MQFACYPVRVSVRRAAQDAHAHERLFCIVSNRENWVLKPEEH
jgi:hypothetical protein